MASCMSSAVHVRQFVNRRIAARCSNCVVLSYCDTGRPSHADTVAVQESDSQSDGIHSFLLVFVRGFA